MTGAQRRSSRRGGNAAKADHYSYTVYADPAMAERFDALRFSGPIGQLIADTQEQAVAAMLAPVEGRRVLDVGTGTGRAAIALARRGADVTGVDASAEMLEVGRRRAGEANVRVTFVRGDAHHLDFADRSFDAIVCLRVLMHTPDWRQALAELCRVADTRLVFDYPSSRSAARVQSWTRHIASRFVRDRIEAYRVLSPRHVTAELSRHGFRILSEHRLFVLPIALHKRIGSVSWTRRIERALARVGLTSVFGSPITVAAERCAS